MTATLVPVPPVRKIFVTSALPYANGSIHLGHLVEYIQTDIWTRFQRLRGHQVWYICADDTHGTPVMLRAEQEKITPEALIARVHEEHQRDFADFHIAFDHYGSTNSDSTRRHSESIYQRLQAAGLIATREIEQLYDSQRKLFLPDRYVRGNCPRCDSPDQYGDSCEKCGAAYAPTDLKNPRSVLSNATPQLRRSQHYFFRLSNCRDMLREFVNSAQRLQPEAANKLKEWLEGSGDQALQDWDISRDAPYFGFRIPGTDDKYFYVWLDAPIGYLGSLQELADAKGFSIDEFIAADSSAEMYHFIGKDILYFHGLFWPAMLHFSGHRVPTGIFAHGFLTVNGQKMSKSRGTFLNATDYLRHLDPTFLRYYYAVKLGAALDDLDLNFDDFVQRVNSDLIGKYINIAARSAGFLEKRFANCLHGQSGVELQRVLPTLLGRAADIAECYERREFGKAMRLVMGLADEVNQYTDAHKPWELARGSEKTDELHLVCSVLIQAFRLLTLYLKPVLPEVAARVERFLACEPLHWASPPLLPTDHVISPYQHLLTRVDAKAIEQMMKEVTAGELPVADAPKISVDDFAKLDLRIAKILLAEKVEGSDKLLKLHVDFGGSDQRTVFAGIAAHYSPQQLEGQLVVAVANLAPRKMRFGTSQAMILAASGEGSEGLFLMTPHAGAAPGMRVK